MHVSPQESPLDAGGPGSTNAISPTPSIDPNNPTDPATSSAPDQTDDIPPTPRKTKKVQYLGKSVIPNIENGVCMRCADINADKTKYCLPYL